MEKMTIKGKNIVEGLFIAGAIIMAETFGILFKGELIGHFVVLGVIVIMIICIVIKSKKK